QAIASKWTQDVLGEKISDLRKRVAVTEQKAHTLNDAETVFEMLKVAALGKQLAEAYEDIKAAREANAPERPRAVGKAADDVIGFVNTAAVGSEAVSVATASAGYLLPLIREFELHT